MERRLVRRVREEAGLEAEALTEGKGLGPAALHGTSEEVAGVELQARGVGEDFERAAGGCFGDEGGGLHGLIGAEVVAVVIATSAAQLVMRGADAFANRVCTTEIKRRIRDIHELARRDERGRHRDEAIGAERQAVVEDAALAGEVEEDVVGQVAGRGGVGRRCEVDGQFVGLVGQGVGDRHAECAWVALFAVGADDGEADRRGVGSADGFGLPDALIEASEATVQMITVIVLRECKGATVDGQLAVREAVGVAADGAAEEGVAGDVVCQ